jgi:hypothetical protein
MDKDSAIALALEELLSEVRRLQMAEQVQKGMWTLLVRHLAVRGQLDADELAGDIEEVARAQDHEDWQALHEGYLEMLRVLKTAASARRRAARRRT